VLLNYYLPLYFNRLFQREKKGLWTKTLACYTSYSDKDIEAVVKKLASLVVKSNGTKYQVSFRKGSGNSA
jgi:hypothetical protein